MLVVGCSVSMFGVRCSIFDVRCSPPSHFPTPSFCHRRIVNNRQYRQKQRNHDSSHHHRQEHNHDRLQQRRHRRHRIIHLVIVITRPLHQHIRQRPCLPAHTPHPRHHCRKHPRRLQRHRDRLPLLD